MRANLLRKTTVCLLAGAFIAGNIYAAGTTTSSTPAKKSTAAKTTTNTKKSDLFGDDKKETKKDKTVVIPPSGWNGTMTVTADASGNPSAASFMNDLDKKSYNIQLDDTTKRLLATVKTGSRVQVKGSVVTKATDNTTSLKLTNCDALPAAPPAPAATTPPAQ